MDRLLNIGFLKIGYWFLKDNRIEYDLSSHYSEKNILYSFISNGIVKYIGKTTMPVYKRMYGYQNPGLTQGTNIRINQKLTEILSSREAVDILVLIDNGLLKYGNFVINLAAGLEDTLIYDIHPEWNCLGKKKIESDKNSENEELTETPKSTQNDKLSSSLIIELGQTYYNQGFFNIGTEYKDKIGVDRENIQIQLGEDPQNTVIGYINRTANENGTARIMIGTKYTTWVQKNYNQGDNLKINIISPTYIKLNKKED